MRVLVTFAVEAEFAPWRKLRALRHTSLDGLDVYQAQIGRASVDFAVTGMGLDNARCAAEKAMSVDHTICIAAGFAGSLKSDHRVGDVLVARAVQQIGTSKTLECSRSLYTAAFLDQAVAAKMFLTTQEVVTTAEEKQRLSPFGDAVDMESFAILSVAKQKNLPAVAIRVVSDRFDEDMPVDIGTTVDEKGRVTMGGICRYIAYHPLQLPALIRLGRKSRTAAEALAHFLEAYIKKLSSSSHGWPPAELQEVAAR